MNQADAPWLARYDPGMPHHIEPRVRQRARHVQGGREELPDAAVPLVLRSRRSRWARSTPPPTRWPPGWSTSASSPGDRLAVYLQNVPQFVLAMLATWKAGGIMVSINPMNKARELEYLLDRLGRDDARHASSRCTTRSAEGVVGAGKTEVRDGDHHERDRLTSATTVPRLLAGSTQDRFPPTRSTSSSSSTPTTARSVAEPSAHRRRRRVPHVHVGHDGSAEGRDEHPPQRRVQLPGVPRLDVAHARRRRARRRAAVPHHRAHRPHHRGAARADAARARLPLRPGRQCSS